MIIDLQGKVAIVTGAGKGIGRAIAGTLAREGVRTIVTDIDASLLQDVAREFGENGWEGAQYACDIRDSARIAEVVAQVVERFERIDVLVNNAGVAASAPVEKLSEEIWDMNQDVNLKGTFLMSQAVIQAMKKQRWGRIINAASFAAIVPILG